MGSAAMQGQLWSSDPETWAKLQEPQVLPFFRRTLDALEPLAGKVLLDAGCGSGLALSIAAERGAQTIGVDAAPGMLEITKRRVPSAELHVGDLESLPLADHSCDVVTAFNSLQFAENPMRALAEFRRVVKPEGDVAIAQWGEAARCQTEALFAQLRSLVPSQPDAPAPLALSGDGRLEARLVDARLHPYRWGEVEVVLSYADYDECYRAFVSAGPIVRVVGLAGEVRVRGVFDRIIKPLQREDGSIQQRNVFRWVISKPAARA